MSNIKKGDITSGEYIRDQKEIYEFPVAKPPKDMDKRKFLPVDTLPENRKGYEKEKMTKGLTATLRAKKMKRESGAGYSGTEDYKQ